MTRDQSRYTSEGIVERIRELRAMHEILYDEEARLLTLKEAADQYKDAVDSRGRLWQKPRSKTAMPGIEKRPAPIREAIASGYRVILPAYQVLD